MIKVGTVKHGAIINLGANWGNTPKVSMSPFTLKSYDSTEPGDQILSVGATEIYQNPPNSGNFYFKADVSLRKSSAQGELSIGYDSGVISLDEWTSPSFTTPTDTLEISVSVSLSSKQGNGLNWDVRNVSAIVQYYESGLWVDGAKISLTLTDLDKKTYTLTQIFNYPASWEVRVKFESVTVPDLTFGDPNYTYHDQTVFRLNVWPPSGPSIIAASSENGMLESVGYSLNFQSISIPGEIYKIDYIFSRFEFDVAFLNTALDNDFANFEFNITHSYGSFPSIKTIYLYRYSSSIQQSFLVDREEVDKTYTVTLDQTEGLPFLGTNLTMGLNIKSYSTNQAKITARLFKDLKAKVYTRVLNPTSTSVENEFTVEGYEFLLDNSILDTGIAHWIASDEL